MPTLKEAIIKRLGGFSSKEASSRSWEAYKGGYQDGGEDEPVSSTGIIRYGYRRQTTGGLRDFTLIDSEQLLQIIWTLYQSNPLIKRACQIKRDYILGGGIAPQTEDSELQEIIDDFWRINNLLARQKEFVLQLFLFGEQCYPAFVRKSDGRVRLGYIDPGEIERVLTHPENALEMWAVIVKPMVTLDPWEKTKEAKIYRIIREESKEANTIQQDSWKENIWNPEASNVKEPYQAQDSGNEAEPEDGKMRDFIDRLFGVADETRPLMLGKLVTHEQAILEDWERDMLKSYGLSEYSGSCFFFRVNSVSNQPRGFSDFLQVADWVDQHDMTLFSLADREQLASYFSWDVTLKGADERQVREKSKKIRAKTPKRGSVNVHNDAEEWKMEYPEIGATNSIETTRALQLQILAGMGYPEHWYGRGDETNRATAQAQGDPTWKTLEHDQGVVENNFLFILSFVKDQAEIAGHWQPTAGEDGEEVSHEINLSMPEMTAKDTSIIANMLSTLSSALMVAEEQGWQDRESSLKIWVKAVQELGIDLDYSRLSKLEPNELGQGQDQGGDSEKSWFNKHGVMLPDEETAESDDWESLSPANKAELLRASIERLGYTVKEGAFEDD